MNRLYRKIVWAQVIACRIILTIVSRLTLKSEIKDTNFAENSVLECSLLSVHINVLHGLLFYLAGGISEWVYRVRTPVGTRFSVPVETGPGACPASHKGSFPGLMRPGPGANHPPSSTAEVKERLVLYFYSPSGPS